MSEHQLVEVMDLSSHTVTETVVIPPSSGITRLLGEIQFVDEKGYLPCKLEESRYGIAAFDPGQRRVIDVYPLSHAVYRIVGVAGKRLLYIDDPALAGRRGISMHVYNLEERKEVRSVNLRQLLMELRPNNK